MAVFTSEEALKKYIMNKVEDAIENTRDEIYNVFEKYLWKYYGYAPKSYQRTYQLLNSLIKTDVVTTGNTVRASVYFDVGALSYPEKVQAYLDGREVSVSAKPDVEKIMNVALYGGTHGGSPKSGKNYGKVNDTAIWDESMIELGAMAGTIEGLILKELKKAGIPVK